MITFRNLLLVLTCVITCKFDGTHATPTSEPSSQPSVLTASPTAEPSSQPSAPSGEPSSHPSSPSGEPSSHPSSLPTTQFPQGLYFNGGGDGSSPVVWEARGLGFIDNTDSLYLSVDVYPTNYENKANQYATIKVNGDTVLLHCTPDESCGSEWFSCLYDLNVSSYRLELYGGSMTVEVSSSGVNTGPCNYLTYPLYTRMYLRGATPSSQPSSEPSSEPTSLPSGTPTSMPSSCPSFLPTNSPIAAQTARPSSQPTNLPSAEPSAQPTSLPTLVSPLWTELCQGGDDSNPVVFNLTQLGYANESGPLYLGVSVFPTNFEVLGSQWATISVNGDEIVPYCNPDDSCGGSMFPCLVKLDVRSRLTETFGGSLQVIVSSTGVEGGPCDHEGFPLYSCVQIGDYIPSTDESGLPSLWVLGPIGGFLLFFLIILCCYCKSSWKIAPEKSSRYQVSDGRGDFGVDLEFNGYDYQKSRRLNSPSGKRSPNKNKSEDFSARSFKLQASGRFAEDDEEIPLRPVRGSSRKKKKSDADGGGDVEDTEERIEKQLKQARSVKKTRKSYNFDGF